MPHPKDTLPKHLSTYKRTPTFTQDTIPKGLLNNHQTRAGVWARVVLETGTLRLTFEDGPVHLLSPGTDGIIAPQRLHAVAPIEHVTFHVEFLRKELE